MFLGYQNGIITEICETREELENHPTIKFDKIEYTNEPVELVWGSYIIGYENIKQSKIAWVRHYRNILINNIKWRVERYTQQKELGIETSDSNEKYIKILNYIQYLREYPQQEGWWVEEPKDFENWCID